MENFGLPAARIIFVLFKASGLPVVREGNLHAVEMARMALEIVQAIKNFRIRHKPNETLKLRIGIHSGKMAYKMDP